MVLRLSGHPKQLFNFSSWKANRIDQIGLFFSLRKKHMIWCGCTFQKDVSYVLSQRKRTCKLCRIPLKNLSLIRNDVFFFLKCFSCGMKKNLPPRIQNALRELWFFITMGLWEMLGMGSYLFPFDLGTL